MFITPLGILYVVLAVCVLALTITLIVLLVNVNRVVKDIADTTDKINGLVTKIDDFIVKPIKLASGILDKVMPIIRYFTDKK